MGVGALLTLAAVGGATDLALNARWPWPPDALEDPFRAQLLLSLLLAGMLCATLAIVVRISPAPDEFDEHGR